MEFKEFPQLQEKLYYEQLENGLKYTCYLNEVSISHLQPLQQSMDQLIIISFQLGKVR